MGTAGLKPNEGATAAVVVVAVTPNDGGPKAD